MTRAGPVNAIANQLTRRLSLEHGVRFKPLGSVDTLAVCSISGLFPLQESSSIFVFQVLGSIAIMLPVRRVGPVGAFPAAQAQQTTGAQVPRQYTLIINAHACRAVLTATSTRAKAKRRRLPQGVKAASRVAERCDPFARCLHKKPGLAKFGVPDRGRCAAPLLGSPCANPAAQVTAGTYASIWRF